jgi:TolB protein
MKTGAVVLAAASVLLVAAKAPGRLASLELTSTPELVAPGVVSSGFSEIRLAMSPDKRTMLWGSTDRPGGPGGWNIWLSRQSDAGWGAPEPAPFDTPANEFDPAFTPDGRYVYFFSNRPGGLGGDDIYRVPVIAKGFGPVEHLGPEVNSAGNEWAPSLSPDGATLLFASDGRGGSGRHDLFVARAKGTGFAVAQALPGAINTPADEFDATFLADGSSVVFARSNDVDNDPISLYFAGRGPNGYDGGTILPRSINVDAGYTLGPTLDWSDRSLLYFSGHRPEANLGKLDLYRVHFRLRP